MLAIANAAAAVTQFAASAMATTTTTAAAADAPATATPTTKSAKSRHHHGPHHRPILAERFKTKVCRNFVETGACPYFFRCMFAHGDHELRTKQMNMADGLYTEEAIKAFKRANYEATKRLLAANGNTAAAAAAMADMDMGCCDHEAEAMSTIVAPSPPGYTGFDAIESPVAIANVNTMMIGGSSQGTDSVSGASEGEMLLGVAAVPQQVAAPVVRRRRHDPYAQFSSWHPLAAPCVATPARVSPAPSAVSSTSSTRRSRAAAPVAPSLAATPNFVVPTSQYYYGATRTPTLVMV